MASLVALHYSLTAWRAIADRFDASDPKSHEFGLPERIRTACDWHQERGWQAASLDVLPVDAAAIRAMGLATEPGEAPPASAPT
jgi:hypothetical protein